MIAQASATQSSLQASRLATVESLLRERRLDRTLARTLPGLPGADSGTPNARSDERATTPNARSDERASDIPMPLGLPTLDVRLAGGLPRGQLSEVVGPASSGRTSVVCAWLAAATRRGEHVALVDTFDRFDPASGAACGLELSRLLWVRGQAISKTAGAVDPAWLPGVRTVHGPGTLLERTIDRALKALNLILQSGVCTAVALDLADVPAPTLGRIPASTWLRVQRVIEGSDTACVVLGPVPIARSAGGITINTSAPQASAFARAEISASYGETSPKRPEGREGGPQASSRTRWVGEHDRARRFAGLGVSVRLMSPRRRVAGTVALDVRVDASV